MWSSLILTVAVATFVMNPACGEVVKLIIDTDLGFDVDDVGAIAVANYLQDTGACEIVAVIYNTAFYKGIGGVDVVNHWFNRSTATLGSYRGQWGSSSDAQDAQDSYTSTVEHDFPSPVQNYDQVPDEVNAYRAALAAAENASIVIASIGEPTALRNILMAEPELFAQKVKSIVYMDGGYNFGCGDSAGSGWSPWLGSTEDCDGAAQYTVEHVPSTVAQYFTLNGEDETTGSRFNDGCGSGPIKEAYQIWTNYGSRPSWDLMAVYFAVMGPGSLYSTANAQTTTVDYYGGETYDYSDTSNNMYQITVDGAHSGDVTFILDNILCADPCLGDVNVGACSGYTLQASHNCWGGHGAVDIDSSVPVGTFTLAKCQQVCSDTDGCDGVVTTPADGGLVSCYRKADIEIGSCDWAPQFNTYTLNASS